MKLFSACSLPLLSLGLFAAVAADDAPEAKPGEKAAEKPAATKPQNP